MKNFLKAIDQVKEKHGSIFENKTYEELKSETLEVKKPSPIERIGYLIEMYEKDRPVLCNVISSDSEIIGVPFKLEDTYLLIKTKEDHYEKISINDIIDIIIIKF